MDKIIKTKYVALPIHWSAWIDGQEENVYFGRTEQEAIDNLVKTLPREAPQQECHFCGRPGRTWYSLCDECNREGGVKVRTSEGQI